jgi:hypothetical protein
MQQSRVRSLWAHAGPRIVAPDANEVELSVARDRMQLEFRQPRDFGLNRVDELLRWPLLRHRRRERWKWTFPAAASLGIVLLVLGQHLWIASSLLLVPLAAAIRARGSALFRSRRHARAALRMLAAGEDGSALCEQLELVLQHDPDNDAARLLLAAQRLFEGNDRSALLQLAPLRDHHPDSGEVVLLAAACYLHLGRPHAALRILEALEIGPGHRSEAAAERLVQAATQMAHGIRTGEPPRQRGSLAEDLLRHWD